MMVVSLGLEYYDLQVYMNKTYDKRQYKIATASSVGLDNASAQLGSFTSSHKPSNKKHTKHILYIYLNFGNNNMQKHPYNKS